MNEIKSDPLVLNLGCGNKINSSMINIDFVKGQSDVLCHNLLLPLPYQENTVDMIYHSNVLEHFNQIDGNTFLKDSFRVLKTNGILRISIPDLENIASEYLRLLREKPINWEDKVKWMKLELIDQISRNKPGGDMAPFLSGENNIVDYVESRIGKFKGREGYREARVNYSVSKIASKAVRHLVGFLSPSWKIGKFRASGETHQWMYEFETLEKQLKKIGFSRVIRTDCQNSNSNWWLANNLDIDSSGHAYDPQNLILEAIK